MDGEFSCSLDLIHTGMLECFFTKFASAFGGELFLLRCDVAPAGFVSRPLQAVGPDFLQGPLMLICLPSILLLTCFLPCNPRSCNHSYASTKGESGCCEDGSVTYLTCRWFHTSVISNVWMMKAFLCIY